MLLKFTKYYVQESRLVLKCIGRELVKRCPIFFHYIWPKFTWILQGVPEKPHTV